MITGGSSLEQGSDPDLKELFALKNELTALPDHLPQALQALEVDGNKLTALPRYLLQNLKSLSVTLTTLKPETLIAFVQSNTSITELEFDRFDTEINTDAYDGAPSEVYPDVFFDEISTRTLDSELLHNARRKAAVTLDLLTRFGLTTTDQTDTLIKRDSTRNAVSDQLPAQPIPAELHDILAANCPKDVLAVLAGMVDGSPQ